MFTQEMREHIKKMREQFFSTGSAKGITGVRKEILEEWKRVYQMGGRITDQDEYVIHEDELIQRIQAQKNLYRITVYYVKKLYNFMKGHGMYISYADGEGYILKNLGDEDIVNTSHVYRVREGAYRGVNNPSLALIQGCLRTQASFSIYSTEHSASINDDWAGTVAPIISAETGSIIGVIGVSCKWNQLNEYSQALVIMLADAISHQLALEQNQLRMNHLYDAVNFGVALLSEDGKIKSISQKAKTLLGLSVGVEYDGEDFTEQLKQNLTWKEIKNRITKTDNIDYTLVFKRNHLSVACVFQALSGSDNYHKEYIVYVRDNADFTRIATKVVGVNTPISLDDIVGNSSEMLHAKEIAKIASNYIPHTLLLGESGTGKELFAQAIHNASYRSDKPFIALNCGAIPKSLIESELFGYEPGAFTGARKNGYIGKFELANGGTIFLDEIGDMPYETQIVLLRVLQSKEITHIGGKTPIKIDVAVIAATNQDLMRKIEDKTFRADLYYRLNTFVINIPPLRKREGDIDELVHHFIKINSVASRKNITEISDEALDILRTHRWPGNVRELENVIERAVLVADDNVIQKEDILIESMRFTKHPNEAASPQETTVPEIWKRFRHKSEGDEEQQI